MWYKCETGVMLFAIALIFIFSLGICKETVGSSENNRNESNMESDEKHSFMKAARRPTRDYSIPADPKRGDLPRKRTKRVVYGEYVDESEYPYIVEIISYDYQRKCAGTLLTPRLVLTAAHCLQHDLHYIKLNLPDMYFGRYYEIERSIPHPGYQFPQQTNVGNTIHDLAILVLENSIPNAQTVELIPPTHNGEFTTARLFGWGMTETGNETRQLRGATVTIMSPSESVEHYGIVDGRICNDGQNGNIGEGDSGGPLMSNEYQIGIASQRLGERCTDGLPSAFTRISAYRDWIEEQIRSVELEPERDQEGLIFGGDQRFWRAVLEDLVTGCCCWMSGI